MNTDYTTTVEFAKLILGMSEDFDQTFDLSHVLLDSKARKQVTAAWHQWTPFGRNDDPTCRATSKALETNGRCAAGVKRAYLPGVTIDLFEHDDDGGGVLIMRNSSAYPLLPTTFDQVTEPAWWVREGFVRCLMKPELQSEGRDANTRAMLRRVLGGQYYAWLNSAEAKQLVRLAAADEISHPSSDLVLDGYDLVPERDDHGNVSFTIRFVDAFLERFESGRTCRLGFNADISLTLYPCGTDWLLYARDHYENLDDGEVIQGGRETLAYTLEWMEREDTTEPILSNAVVE